jgi:ADP-heptose:LPS heptosyltransferase
MAQVFVYRPGAIGDTILTLPALGALRRRFPGARIVFAGNAALSGLLPVDAFLSADDPRLLPLFQDPPTPWPGADVHVILARQPAGLPGIQRDPLQAAERQVHVADWLVDAVDPTFEDRIPRLDVPAGVGKPLVIHAGAGGAGKRWPAERFAALAQALNLPLAVVQGPADPDLDLAREHEVWRDLPLAELAARLKGSGLFVGNDSGISHLAAAAGTPAVAVYVRTNPAIWGIRGARVRHLIGDVSVAEAAEACRQLVP